MPSRSLGDTEHECQQTKGTLYVARNCPKIAQNSSQPEMGMTYRRQLKTGSPQSTAKDIRPGHIYKTISNPEADADIDVQYLA
jgi:hypothetical protein